MAKKKKKTGAGAAGAAATAADGIPPTFVQTPASVPQAPQQQKQQQQQQPQPQPQQHRQHYTLSLAVPASLIEDAPSAEAATLLAAAVARAAALHRADELVVVDDTPQRKDGTVGAAAALVARVAQALETPPYLRPHLLPLAHPDLAHLAACPPLGLPCHLRPTEWCRFREGVVMATGAAAAAAVLTPNPLASPDQQQQQQQQQAQQQDPTTTTTSTNTTTTTAPSSSLCTFVDVGLDRMAVVKGAAAAPPIGARVTVRLGPSPRAEYVASHGESMLLAELADADAPRRELFAGAGGRAAGAWGFSVRLAKGMHGLLRECPFSADGEGEGGGGGGGGGGGEGDEGADAEGAEAVQAVGLASAENGDLAAAARRMMEERKRQQRAERERKQQQAAAAAAAAANGGGAAAPPAKAGNNSDEGGGGAGASYDLVIGLSAEEGQAVRRAEDLALPRGFRHALVVLGAPGPAGGLRGSLARDKRLRGKDLAEVFDLLLSPLPTSAFAGAGGGGGGGKQQQQQGAGGGGGGVPSAALQRAARGLRCEDAALLGLALLSPALEAYGLGGGGGDGGTDGMVMGDDSD